MANLVLLPNDPYGMGFSENKAVIATSRAVADYFEKQHGHVLRDIDQIIIDLSKIGAIKEEYFVKSSYKDDRNRKQPQWLMTRDGFTLLTMSFTGPKAMKFK